jgi:dihydroflavonol-4-reductase
MESSRPVLVTGATGSIGSMLVKRLSEAGRRVRALARNPERAAGLRADPNVEMVWGDLGRPDTLRGCADGCSVVFHCGAAVNSASWAGSFAANVTGTAAIVEEAARAGVERLVYTSTIGVYGLCRDEIITEQSTWTRYHSPYFETKQEAERIVEKAAGCVPVSIARLGDVFGPGQYVWTINIAEQMKRGLLKPLLDAQSGYLNPIYIDNLVDALLAIGSHPAAANQVYNVVDGCPIRASDYFRRYNLMGGKRPGRVPAVVLKAAATALMGYESITGREPSVTPSSIKYLLRKGKIFPDRLRAELGWAPAVAQEEAFARTEKWLRETGYLA